MAIAPLSTPQPLTIYDLFEEVTLQIFTEFTGLELGKIMRVCTTWHRLASDPSLWTASKLQELNCNVIDEKEWQLCFPRIAEDEWISFEGIPTLDYRLAFFEVGRFYARLKAAGTSVEGDQGVTILTIPKGLFVHRVYALFDDRIVNIMDRFLKEFGWVEVDQAYRVIMTKNVLTGSRGKSALDQRGFVDRTGCSRPKALEVMALALLTEKITSVRLFCDNPQTFTACSEGFEFPVIVGGFEPEGIHVDGLNFYFAHLYHGAAVCQKL